MIHIIDNPPAAENQPLLRSMFADRKRLFVDLFGWDVPVVDDQYEIDQFDNADTIYLIVADDDGEHVSVDRRPREWRVPTRFRRTPNSVDAVRLRA